LKRKAHVPRYVGSGSEPGDDVNAEFKAALRAKKTALQDIYREIGLDPPTPPGRPQKPVPAPPAPTPADTPTVTDPVAAEAALVAARLREFPDDRAALSRAAELADQLEKRND